MPDIQAFRGLRYDLGQIGSLSDVIAPPYDVIDEELQDQLYKRHAANVIRLILNREEPGDEPDEKYRRAAKLLREWRRDGVLTEEGASSLYVYHQLFTVGGVQRVRRGFMARVKLEPFGEGKIFPHEETHSAAKADRLKLTRACKANLSQIFGLYPDPENAAQDRLEEAIQGVSPLEATDHLGVVHRIWPVDNMDAITETAALLAGKPMFIADGHHRYETACNYKAELGAIPSDHPANYVLTMCVGMSDPGMIVLPTHRLFYGAPKINSETLIAKLGGCFATRVAGEGADLAESIWQQMESENRQEVVAMYCAEDQRWVVCRLTDEGRRRMAELSSDRSSDWQQLGVAILHRLIMDTLLEAGELPKPNYLHQVEEVVEELSGDTAMQYPLAALVMPATLEHIRLISEHNERMPAKSTYFYPKLLSGLVINSID